MSNNLQIQILENAGEKLARMMTATGVAVHFTPECSGPAADIEQGIIYMPPIPDKLAPEDLQIMHGALDHEAAHIDFTKRVDGTRPRKLDGYKGKIENIIEDGRINRMMGQKFLGSQENIAALYRLTNAKAREEEAKARAENGGGEAPREYRALAALFKATSSFVWKRPEIAATYSTSGDELFAKLPPELRAQLEAIETHEQVVAAIDPVLKWLSMDDGLGDPKQPEQPKGPQGPEGQPQQGQGGQGGQGQQGGQQPQNGQGEGEGEGEGSEGAANAKDGTKNGQSKQPGTGEKQGEGEKPGAGSGKESKDGKKAEGAGNGSQGKEKGQKEASSGSKGEGKDAKEGKGPGGRSQADGTAVSDEVTEGRSEKGQVNGNPGLGVGGSMASEYEETATDESLAARIAEIAQQLDRAVQRALPTAINCDNARHYIVDRSQDKEIDIHELVRSRRATPGTTDGEWVRMKAAEIFTGYKSVVASIRSRLIIDLQARGKMWNRDLRRGRRLDTGALTRPSVGDPRVFASKVKQDAVDTVVTMLIDFSGSMNGRNKINTALQLAALFCEALEMENIPCEVLGFTTNNKMTHFGIRAEGLNHYILKGYNERLMSVRDKWPVAILRHSMLNNVDGEAVMWAAKRIVRRKEERKILMVLSDGIPAMKIRAEKDTPRERMLKNIDNAYLKQAVQKIELAGIETLGIGIQSDAVRSFYPKNVMYTKLEDMMKGVYTTISGLLRNGALKIAV